MRPRRSASSSTVPGLRRAVAVERRWSSHPAISADTILVRSCSATSGMRRLYGIPSMLTRWVKRNGWASASCVINAPPLECPTTGSGRPGLTWSNTVRASRMSASHEYSSGCSLSPWPRWSQLTTRQPPACEPGCERGRRCERSRIRRGRAGSVAHRRHPTRAQRSAARWRSGGTGERDARRRDSRIRSTGRRTIARSSSGRGCSSRPPRVRRRHRFDVNPR